MANPIQKNDLISDDALRALEEMSRLLREDKENMDALMASFKQYAGSIQTATTANSGNNDALAAALQKVSELEKAYSELQNAMKENTETQKRVNDEKRKYKKLTDDEIQAVEDLKSALAGTAQEQINAVKNINIQNKSYNELNATYNALKDSLNKLTVAERQNTDAGKAMTEQARNIRDTMNQLQQATGNYTLNVGNYASAFNGLRFQTQQLLREIPSAVNVQQFFLAISNNIPMFADALSRYNKALPEMKVKMASITVEIARQEAEMAGLNAQTAEYASKQAYVNSLKKQEIELQALTKGGWKSILKSVVSWQTAILVGIMLLQKFGTKIIDMIASIFKGTKELYNATVDYRRELNSVNDSIKEATRSLEIELGFIINDLKEAAKGSKDWQNAILRVNEITNSNLDATHATLLEVEKVTAAYIEQQRQIAANKIVVDRYSSLVGVKYALGEFFSPNTDMSGILKLLENSNLTEDELDILKDAAEMKKRVENENFESILKLRPSWVNEESFYDFITKGMLHGSYVNGSFNSSELNSSLYGYVSDVLNSKGIYGRDERQRYLKELEDAVARAVGIYIEDGGSDYEDAVKIVNNALKRYEQLNKSAKAAFNKIYNSIPVNKNKSGSDKTYSLKDVDFLESELLDKDAVVELESDFKHRLAMLDKMEEKERLLLKEKYEQESKDLEFNREKHLITEKEYQEQRKKLDDNYNDLIKTNYEGNFEKMGVIQRKYWNKRNEITAKEAEREEKEALKREKKAIKDLENEYASQYRIVQRRIKTIQQEKQQNKDIAFNISLAKEELGKLNEMVITAGEDATGYTERINKLTQQIEKWKKQMQFDKQLSNYGSVWDIFQRNGAFEAGNGTMRGIAKNLLGDLADSLDDEQIEQVYDTWLQNTQKAATEWYNTTMGYINDLISAYVELANAKAEAAAEATEAAQEEYDKEKALLEAGYASRVEATWAEYQEKKAAQEKAEADAKAAAKAQQDINEISTAGNMIVAASNIWKTFSAMGPLGMAAAAAAITAMFGAFIQSKIKAAEVSKYGEGGFEVLEGGSHASGHDIDLGVKNRKGRRMRAEGKEGLGIFRIRAMNHYGADNIEGWVNSINRLEFEGNAAKRMSLERSVGMAVLSAPRTDLHRVESDLHKLVGYGSRSRTVNADGSVTEIRKNAKIVYKNG